MVDPNAPQGLPPGVPPGPGAAPPGVPGMPGAPGPATPPLPTTNPQAMMAVLEALRQQDQAQFQAQQDAALGTAVTELLKQVPNQAGMDASTMPGGPTPPPMPTDPNAAPDPSLSAGGGGYGP